MTISIGQEEDLFRIMYGKDLYKDKRGNPIDGGGFASQRDATVLFMALKRSPVEQPKKVAKKKAKKEVSDATEEGKVEEDD